MFASSLKSEFRIYTTRKPTKYEKKTKPTNANNKPVVINLKKGVHSNIKSETMYLLFSSQILFSTS